MRRHMTRSGRPPLQEAVCLIVDDDPNIRQLLRRILERNGAHVEEVATGAEALLRAIACDPDLILLDYNLPDLDGLAVCRALRENASLFLTPIVMVTGADIQGMHVEALTAGPGAAPAGEMAEEEMAEEDMGIDFDKFAERM